MHFAFRADASIQIGSGHVMRCLTLAEALRNRGHECSFLCRDHPGNLLELIAQKGFEVHLLKQNVPVDRNTEADTLLAHAGWLGASWQQDAEQTLRALNGKNIDWLVVDHYALDARWENRMASHVKKIMVIDDIADRQHKCNLLLDQNLGRQAEDYNGLVPEACIRLIGPHYALLRPEFSELRERSLERRRTPKLKRILITLGGIDRDNVTGQVLGALAKSQLPPETELDIVMGASAPALEDVRRKAHSIPFRTSLSVNVTDMAERMCLADLCIGAAGSTSWERCCLGLATILLVLAENQQGGAKALGQAGAALVVYQDDDISDTLPGLVNKLLVSGESLDIGKMAAAITDGRGASLVVAAMLECAGGNE